MRRLLGLPRDALEYPRMPTLYVENVPEELYQALRDRARANRRSLAAETIRLLEEALPTPAELRERAAFYRRVRQIRRAGRRGGPGPSAEQLLREDRNR